MCMIIPIPKQSCEPSLACTKMMSREILTLADYGIIRSGPDSPDSFQT